MCLDKTTKTVDDLFDMVQAKPRPIGGRYTLFKYPLNRLHGFGPAHAIVRNCDREFWLCPFPNLKEKPDSRGACLRRIGHKIIDQNADLNRPERAHKLLIIRMYYYFHAARHPQRRYSL